MSYRLLFLTLFFLKLAIRVAAQDSTLVYKINFTGSAISSNQTPFWLASNSYGTVPTNGSYLLSQIGIKKIYNPHNPRFVQWAAGAELITSLSKKNDLFFSELYGAVLIGPVELSIGNRKSVMGIADSTLSMGSVAMSQNYRPFPKIEISTPNYVNAIPRIDFISFKFNYSDGLLGGANVAYGNVSYVPAIYMHQKSLYLKLGGKKNKINLFGGFNHQAMWGGENKIFTGGLNSGLAYKYVVLGRPWQGSRIGNHFGSIDLGLNINGKKWDYLFYRQSIYEDGSLSKLSNVADGLNGFRIKRKTTSLNKSQFVIHTLLLEYLNTKSQGGAVFDYDKGIFGNDNYFNHYVYPQGWSYRGRGLGTPMINSKGIISNKYPSPVNEFTNNNRISAIQIGANAAYKNWDYVLKTTFSQNLGTYSNPFEKSIYQSNFLFKASHAFGKQLNDHFSVTFAGDYGKLYSNSFALTVGYSKFGFLN